MRLQSAVADQRRRPGIHTPRRGYGFRARARARPGMTSVVLIASAAVGQCFDPNASSAVPGKRAKPPFVMMGAAPRCADAAYRLMIAARNRASRSSRSLSVSGGVARVSAVMRWNNSQRELTAALSEASRAPRFSATGPSGFSRFRPYCCLSLGCCGLSGKSDAVETGRQGRDSSPNTVQKGIVIKTGKDGLGPFPKPACVGTYPSRPRACPGCLLRKYPDGIDRRPRALAESHSGSVFEGAHRFIAGWSSPVARQAHNLKVIGSNPIPATKFDAKNPVILMDCWVFAFWASAEPERPLDHVPGAIRLGLPPWHRLGSLACRSKSPSRRDLGDRTPRPSPRHPQPRGQNG
jgi:hypothetical protein